MAQQLNSNSSINNHHFCWLCDERELRVDCCGAPGPASRLLASFTNKIISFLYLFIQQVCWPQRTAQFNQINFINLISLPASRGAQRKILNWRCSNHKFHIAQFMLCFILIKYFTPYCYNINSSHQTKQTKQFNNQFNFIEWFLNAERLFCGWWIACATNSRSELAPPFLLFQRRKVSAPLTRAAPPIKQSNWLNVWLGFALPCRGVWRLGAPFNQTNSIHSQIHSGLICLHFFVHSRWVVWFHCLCFVLLIALLVCLPFLRSIGLRPITAQRAHKPKKAINSLELAGRVCFCFIHSISLHKTNSLFAAPAVHSPSIAQINSFAN